MDILDIVGPQEEICRNMKGIEEIWRIVEERWRVFRKFDGFWRNPKNFEGFWRNLKDFAEILRIWGPGPPSQAGSEPGRSPNQGCKKTGTSLLYAWEQEKNGRHLEGSAGTFLPYACTTWAKQKVCRQEVSAGTLLYYACITLVLREQQILSQERRGGVPGYFFVLRLYYVCTVAATK